MRELVREKAPRRYSGLPVFEECIQAGRESVFTWFGSDRPRGNGFKLKEGNILLKGVAELEQVAQRGCGHSVPGAIQGWVGQNPGHPDLVHDNPAHSRDLELNDLYSPAPA